MNEKHRANNSKEARVFHYARPLRLRERLSLRFMGWRDGRHGLVREAGSGEYDCDILRALPAQEERDVAYNVSIAAADRNEAKKRIALIEERVQHIEERHEAYEKELNAALEKEGNVIRLGEEDLPPSLCERRRVAEVKREFAARTAEDERDMMRLENYLCEKRELMEEIATRDDILQQQTTAVGKLREIRGLLYIRSARRAIEKRKRRKQRKGGRTNG